MTMPTKLGKYEIRRELGAGAMGVVYEGWDPGIARRVAIKTVKGTELQGAEAEQTLARFRHEAQAAGRLSHPNIVQIYEFGDIQDSADGFGGTQFIAMEFIEGKELKDYFDADERFKLPEIVRIMKELLAALGHAHKNGIVHRDVKPANIILLGDGTVKVADFGIARIESSNLTQAGSVLGTPAYMSPEQFMGQTVDPRSDLFSAGVVLYQFLTGEKPFTGSVTTIMHKVLKEQPIAPSELNVQVPQAFDALIRKALSKRPDERFQSATEFAAALEAAASGQAAAEATMVNAAGEATLAGATITDRPAPAAGAPAAAPSSAGAAATKRAPTVAIAAGVVVVVAGVAAWLMFGRSADTIAPAPQAAAPAAVAPARPAGSTPGVPTSAAEPGTAVITALGLADPGDPRYAVDKGLLAADLREDAKRQLIEKAAALYVDGQSLAKNYGLLQAKLFARSGDFIQAIEEAQPQQNADGLMSLSARATVKVRAVQKSLNQMSRDERVDFIRNNGDPKIAVAITTHSAQGNVVDPNAPAQRSPVAENLLKERIQSFGFRLWNDDMKDAADFSVTGEARFKKLSARLEASGVTVEKFVLSSWSVKCTDKKSGEEIYYNNQIPEKQSWATEEQALRDVGHLIGEEFSKSFFLQHFNFTAQQVVLNFTGLPKPELAKSLLRELTGMRSVLTVSAAGATAGQARYDAALSGGNASPAELVGNGIVKPLNRKLGKTCFNVTGSGGAEVTLAFEPGCGDTATLGRLDALPPAALYDAPPPRREAVIRNPETLKKLSI
ncbi:serine/threonine-protein kinase [Sulfurisoma sediminicola]|uniref:non-specific serine/threonine protein kinase n=1 Tax=Sulfurisoma sediminicola TaxID=1381557 RepID=A0A497XP04_9PROT|nr:serine/threonine-protein kinase [Sulfurisoma sediminicola]RLJ68108.1 serine/threonine-protein kinase [Sulfurisoma sediminicola]